MAIPLRDNAPSYDIPWVNLGLIGGCVVVFLLQLTHPGGLEGSREMWGEVPTRILAGDPVPGTSISAWVTLFTSMWMHADIFHLLGNVYALWLFGDNIEWLLGRARYLLFYLACGLAASLFTTVFGYQSDMAGLGASGAIAGVMCAYLIAYPRAKITSIVWFSPFSIGHAMSGSWGFQVRNMSAFWFVGTWVVFQVWWSGYMLFQGQMLNLGIYAHATGAVAGACLVYALANKRRWPKPEHHTRSAALTSVIIGDEGDAGGGSEPVSTLGEELERIREEHKASKYAIPEQRFVDYTAEELMNTGKLTEAREHCREMLVLAKERGERHRELGYERILYDIADRMRKRQTESVPPETYRAESYEQRVERVKRMLRGGRGVNDPPDWL